MSNREVMQQALEWLDKESWPGFDEWVQEGRAIRASLRAALAEPTGKDDLQVEPVAWLIKWVNANDGVPQGEWQRGYDAARNVVRAHLKAAQQVVNQEMTTEQCHCGDRPAAECPGEWEPGCDLGANEAHAKVYEPQETKEKGVCASYAQTPSRQGSPQGEQRERAHQAPDLSSIVPAPQRQPLSDKEIDRVTDAQWAANNHKPVYAAHRAFARAIEAAHGIGGQR